MLDKYRGDNLSYGIVGLGRFGSALAMEMAELKADIIVIDKDEEKIREMRELTENALIVPNLDKKSLLETGIQNCDVAVVCIGEKMDTSILTTLNLVDLGIPRVIAKATSHEHGKILEKLGAEVVYPEHDMAIRLASRLEESDFLDFAVLGDGINISKLVVSDDMVDQTIAQLKLRERFGANIIAIENDGSVTEFVDAAYEIREDDILYMVGKRKDLVRLAEWMDE